MIPTPDMQLTLNVYIAEEVVRMVCATIGFAIAVWGMVKIVATIAKSADNTQSPSEHG